jgi:hypothetical protein
MLNLQGITFNGIYNVNFPKNTSPVEIQEKANKAETFLKKIYEQRGGYAVKAFDRYIRIVTDTDNPWLLVNLFQEIGGKDLAEKYIKKVAIDINI